VNEILKFGDLFPVATVQSVIEPRAILITNLEGFRLVNKRLHRAIPACHCVEFTSKATVQDILTASVAFELRSVELHGDHHTAESPLYEAEFS
jgi:hypothetical protein